jgi:preprotein translocase subunit SecB
MSSSEDQSFVEKVMWDPQVKEEQEETRIFLVEIQFAKGIFMIEGRKTWEGDGEKWQVP